MNENGSEGLLVMRVEPLEMAKRVCELMVEQVRVTDGALELNVDPAYAAAINTVLAEKGMTVSELRPYPGNSMR